VIETMDQARAEIWDEQFRRALADTVTQARELQ
jgi:hypothetical protein